MFRTVATLLLAGAVALTSVAPALAQGGLVTARAPWGAANLSGRYTNMSGGGICTIQGWGGQYLFTNENGSQAIFAFTGPRRLEMVRGEWDPNIIVTVGSDRLGRTLLRFDAPNTVPGYWLQTG
jgi:hypothetical protein